MVLLFDIKQQLCNNLLDAYGGAYHCEEFLYVTVYVTVYVTIYVLCSRVAFFVINRSYISIISIRICKPKSIFYHQLTG